MNKIKFLHIAILAIFAWHCDNPFTSNSQTYTSVSIKLLCKSQANSTYNVTVTGYGMSQIGPNQYSGSQSIEMYVPQGSARRFRFERFTNSVLTDTGTTVKDIVSGMNIVSVTLIPLTVAHFPRI